MNFSLFHFVPLLTCLMTRMLVCFFVSLFAYLIVCLYVCLVYLALLSWFFFNFYFCSCFGVLILHLNQSLFACLPARFCVCLIAYLCVCRDTLSLTEQKLLFLFMHVFFVFCYVFVFALIILFFPFPERTRLLKS